MFNKAVNTHACREYRFKRKRFKLPSNVSLFTKQHFFKKISYVKRYKIIKVIGGRLISNNNSNAVVINKKMVTPFYLTKVFDGALINAVL